REPLPRRRRRGPARIFYAGLRYFVPGWAGSPLSAEKFGTALWRALRRRPLRDESRGAVPRMEQGGSDVAHPHRTAGTGGLDRRRHGARLRGARHGGQLIRPPIPDPSGRRRGGVVRSAGLDGGQEEGKVRRREG